MNTTAYQRTKDFTWPDGPDPTTWPWEWWSQPPGYLRIVSRNGEVIADIWAARHVRIYPAAGSVGAVEEGKRLAAAGFHPLQVLVSGVRLFESPCTSWRDGVRIVEEWLRDVPVWGTPDDIRWTGWLA